MTHLNCLSVIGWRNMQDARQEVHLDGVHICAAKRAVHFKDMGSFGVHISFWVCICHGGN